MLSGYNGEFLQNTVKVKANDCYHSLVGCVVSGFIPLAAVNVYDFAWSDVPDPIPWGHRYDSFYPHRVGLPQPAMSVWWIGSSTKQRCSGTLRKMKEHEVLRSNLHGNTTAWKHQFFVKGTFIVQPGDSGAAIIGPKMMWVGVLKGSIINRNGITVMFVSPLPPDDSAIN